MLRASTVALVALAVLALNSSAQDGDFNMLTDPVTGSSLVLSAGSDFALVATGEYMVLYEYDGTPLNTIEFDGAIIAMGVGGGRQEVLRDRADGGRRCRHHRSRCADAGDREQR